MTGNHNKLKEVRAIIGEEHAEKFVLEAKKVDLPELQGEPEDIAREKVMLAAKDIGGEERCDRLREMGHTHTCFSKKEKVTRWMMGFFTLVFNNLTCGCTQTLHAPPTSPERR